MPNLISSSTPKSQKEHKCQLCGGTIPAGEVYDRQFLKYEGDVYTFNSHQLCSFISSALWNFIDPDDGMAEDDFKEGCQDYCSRFVCPHCEYLEKSEDEECSKDEEYCLDRIADRLKTHKLINLNEKYGFPRWGEQEIKQTSVNQPENP